MKKRNLTPQRIGGPPRTRSAGPPPKAVQRQAYRAFSHKNQKALREAYSKYVTKTRADKQLVEKANIIFNDVLLVLGRNEPGSIRSEPKLDINNDIYKEVNPEQGLSQSGFNVSFKWDRSTGSRRIGQVSVNGRVPTGYPTGNQGPHIVAQVLLYKTIESSLKGKTVVPKPNPYEKTVDKEDAIATLENILKFPDVSEAGELIIASRRNDGNVKEITKDTINAKLDLLKDRKELNFELIQFGLDQTEFKEAVRKTSRILITDLNIVTENIVRLWNRRRYTVHYKELEKYFLYRTTQIGTKNEGDILTKLKKIHDKGEKLASDDVMNEMCAELIDLKDNAKEFDTEEEYDVNIPSPRTTLRVQSAEELKELYVQIRDSAIEETARLLTIFLPEWEGTFQDEFRNALVNLIDARV